MDPMPPDQDFSLEAYSYELPPENIAQHPAEKRDQSRLLVLERGSGRLSHRMFADMVDYLAPEDLLVLNNTRVFPARLLGRKESGGQVEFFLLEYPQGGNDSTVEKAAWSEVMALGLVRSSKGPRPGMRFIFNDQLEGTVQDILSDGKVRLRLRFQGGLDRQLARHGRMPLPPYIRREGAGTEEDRRRYQTVFASETGAVAAPTAGLHFTEALLAKIRRKGTGIAAVTLHVGYGTFSPVRTADIREHQIHGEFLEISEDTARQVNDTRKRGGKVWAVGTTAVRALEFGADKEGRLQPMRGICDLYIYPGYKFQIVDNLITNFHLPRSSLLFLVSALVGRETLFRVYREAIRQNYRFYSYGDAMAIVTG
jgi:S-adenosylmethionine:tRNA ribosyltransferase-isomerase